MGPNGEPHNRVELLFGAVDTELARVQRLFNQLESPDDLTFDDLIGLAVTVAVQRIRTAQQRRLREQHNEWLLAQNPDFKSFDDPENPHSAAGVHTQLLFSAMWQAADVLATRQIEVWHDARARFVTCDAPVIVPFVRNVAPGLEQAEYIVWPISPRRAVALGRELLGEKAIIREATGKHVGIVRDGVLQGRERMIFSSEEEREWLPQKRLFRRRPQVRLRCSKWTPRGEYLEPPACCVGSSDVFAAEPDVVLCRQGLHVPAPEMWKHV